MVRDPVCLMELDPRHAKAMAEHEGHTYYFCSDDCKQKFLDQPQVYLDKVPGMCLTVGVMGSAEHEQTQQAIDKAYTLGR